MTPESLLADARATIAAGRSLVDDLVRAPALATYHEISVGLANASNRAHLMASVHPDRAMRDAGEVAERELSAFATELSLHRGVYDALVGLPISDEPDTRRYQERLLRDFRRAGVTQDEPIRARVRELAEREVAVGQAFNKNIAQDVRSIRVPPEKLGGLPADYRAAHPPGEDGLCTITTDYPDFFPFRSYADDHAARRELHLAFTNRAYPQNQQVLIDLFALRREHAALLGYSSWADYVTEDKMSRSAAKVSEFIDRVASAAKARSEEDYAALLTRKRQDDPAAGAVYEWDRWYYEEKLQKERLGLDAQAIRPYLEFGRVRQGLLEVTGEMFGISYQPVVDPTSWHPDVTSYDVVKGGVTLGRIHLDLHPRDGKYKHAAQYSLVEGVAGRQLPQGVLVCNFTDPKKASPALMEHSQVVTLFHEFGHLVHHVLGGAQRWIYFSGVATEWDFVEAPSQMLEEWAWDATTLRRFARHHATGEPIPVELVERMRASRELGKGLQVRNQVSLAAVSLAYHLGPTVSLDAVWQALQERYSPFPYVSESHFACSFLHLRSYTAMYYTYQWSLVIAKDLLSEFQKHGLTDPATCRRYRDSILVPGGSKDAADLVRDFLGRDFGFDAYRTWLEA